MKREGEASHSLESGQGRTKARIDRHEVTAMVFATHQRRLVTISVVVLFCGVQKDNLTVLAGDAEEKADPFNHMAIAGRSVEMTPAGGAAELKVFNLLRHVLLDQVDDRIVISALHFRKVVWRRD